MHGTYCSHSLKTAEESASAAASGRSGTYHGRRLGNSRTLLVALGRGEARWSLLSFQATAAGGAPTAQSCPRIPEAEIPCVLSHQIPLHTKLGCTIPVCLAGAPPPSPVPPSALTPASITANTPHHRDIIAADVPQLWQTCRLPAGFQINWSLLSLVQEMQRLRQRQSSTGVPDEPPHRSWTFSKLSAGEVRGAARQQLLGHRPPPLQLRAASKPRDTSFLPNSWPRGYSHLVVLEKLMF